MVRSTLSPGGLYIRIHCTHQTQESQSSILLKISTTHVHRTNQKTETLGIFCLEVYCLGIC
uniref:Similarity. Hypothetical start n=1 Tax=Microcystis aeruginosa (strain PCC 7806) TaxID=267872 RepID=A8YI32_MICA7|nr:unnamed protein product [Microcystis aeruginosa PCC 7806]